MDKIEELEDIQKIIIELREANLLSDNSIYQYLQIAYNQGRIYELNKRLEDSRS